MQYHRYDGDEPVTITVGEIGDWVRRVREDLQGFTATVTRLNARGANRPPEGEVADLLSALKDYADDAAGAAAELQNIAEATLHVEFLVLNVSEADA